MPGSFFSKKVKKSKNDRKHQEPRNPPGKEHHLGKNREAISFKKAVDVDFNRLPRFFSFKKAGFERAKSEVPDHWTSTSNQMG